MTQGYGAQMQLSPRYGNAPPFLIENPVGDPLALMVQQRARLAGLLATFDDAAWSSPSRCAGWTVQDVVTHLVTTNRFWTASIAAGLAGKPTTVLATFDPVASPAAIVAGLGQRGTSYTLEAFTKSTVELEAAALAVGDRVWTTLAECPAGHVAIGFVAMHALWDAVIHERDIMAPLGLSPTENDAELVACITYAVAFNLALLANSGSTRHAAIRLRGTNPSADAIVELGASVLVRPNGNAEVKADKSDMADKAGEADVVVLQGPTVALLEALSCRAPMADFVGDDDRWLFEGIGIVFDQPSRP